MGNLVETPDTGSERNCWARAVLRSQSPREAMRGQHFLAESARRVHEPAQPAKCTVVSKCAAVLFRIELRREIPFAQVRQDDDDALAGAIRTAGDLQGGPGGGPARNAAEDALDHRH